MSISGKRSSHFPLMSVIVMFLTFASANGFSMIIPLEKGNEWNYSYKVCNLHSSSTTTAVDTTIGQISFSVDSVEILSGLNDTTYFRLAIIDSGIANDSSLSNYRLSYSKYFYACHDTLYSLDTLSSPGFSKELLFFYKMPDTSIFRPVSGFSSLYYSRRTDSTSIMIGPQQFESFSRVTDTGQYRIDPTTKVYKDITFQWINRIGAVYYSVKYLDSFAGVTVEGASRTYTLLSFNGTPIPPISITAIKADQLLPKADRPMADLNKIVYGTKSVPEIVFGPKMVYFNLQGQKMGRPMGGQMLIEKRVLQP
jgi:hypothetical protein